MANSMSGHTVKFYPPTTTLAGEVFIDYERYKTSTLFNELMNKEHEKNEQVQWNNLSNCLELLARNEKYRTYKTFKTLLYEYFRDGNPQEYHEQEYPPRATADDMENYINSLTNTDVYVCNSDLKIACAIIIHHLKITNNNGHGETFKRCSKCGCYFPTRREKYCSEKCKNDAKQQQMTGIQKNPKYRIPKQITDRYTKAIKKALADGNNTRVNSLQKEKDTFAEAHNKMKRKLKEQTISEAELIQWLEQQNKILRTTRKEGK